MKARNELNFIMLLTMIRAVCVEVFIAVVTRNKLNFIMQKLRVIS